MNAYTNIEAEINVLGAAMQSDKALKAVVEMDPDDFSEPAHRLILNAMKDLSRAGTPVDLVTMYAELQKANRIEIIGGAAYLPKLVSSVVTTANVKSYIRIVRECATRRRLRGIGESLIQASAEPEKNVDEIRETAALDIRKVKGDGGIKLVNQEQAVIDTYEQLSDAQKREDHPDNRIMTGLGPLDKMTGGLYGSKLMIIGARPSVGKSIFAMTICLNAAKQGKRVLYITMEMKVNELMEREFASASMVNLSEITSGEISEDGWIKLAESIPTLVSKQIFYCTDGYTVEDIRMAAFMLYEDGGIDLICVDYLQLLEGSKKRSNRQEEVSDISRGLKRLAQELNIPIIALSQLNRGNAKEKRPPTMNDARESGAIEQDANIFLLLHDPDVDELKNEDLRRLHKNLGDRGMKLIYVNVDKNRQGRKGIFYIAFDGDHMRFLPLSKEEPNE